jgi:nucleoside phosphorylase
MRTAIFCALRWECRPVLKAMRRVSRQTVGHWRPWRAETPAGEVWLVQTGVGAKRAADAAAAFADSQQFDLFLSVGCAGALSADLRGGDLVVASAAVGDEGSFDTDTGFRARAGDICAVRGLPWHCGAMLTSPTVLTTALQRQEAAARSGAIAVEMEAAGIAAAASRRGIAFAQVRSILDAADIELHESGDFMDAETGRLRVLDTLRFVATHPGATSQLLALRRMMVAAEHALEGFFAVYLGPQHSGPSPSGP